MEEFLESEVLWPDNTSSQYSALISEETKKSDHIGQWRNRYSRHGVDRSASSTPIMIPCGSDVHNPRESRNWRDEKEEQSTADAESMVPPHVMMSRMKSNGGMTTEFSLRSGQGRTLRGRELWHVRNTVWRMTGFVDG